jgi:hypothetical protein
MSLYSIPSEDDIVYGKKQSDTVRSSQQTWVVMIPINVTLGVAGTADTMFDVDTNRHKATRNTLTNPSFETGSPPTGYTAVSSTLTRSAVTARTGTYSMKIVTGNSVAAEGFTIDTQQPVTPVKDVTTDGYTFSIYAKGLAGGEIIRLRITDASGNVLGTSDNATLSNSSWTRLFLTVKPRESSILTLAVLTPSKQNISFYVDDAQFERWPSPTAYCDGDQSRMCKWEGTAHASTSVRHNPIVEIKGYTFETDEDVYIDFDRTATSSSRLLGANKVTWNQFPVSIKKITFINKNVGETPTITGELWGVVQTGNE